MEKISDNTELIVLDTEETLEKFLSNNLWLDKKDFKDICTRYGFPEMLLTVVIEKYYIDAVYRDVYYNYWSKSHFSWPRHCTRLFLFHNEHSYMEFYDGKYSEQLNCDFLGTIVVRPSYSSATDHTLGRTLLNPYKMTTVNGDGKVIHPYVYLATAKYKFHLLGNTYTTRAFPFLSQDGVVMKCAETAVCELCDYASAFSARYAEVLPSYLQATLKERLPERGLPSHGLYCNDISFLLGKFGFSPMIYASTGDVDRAEGEERDKLVYDNIRIGCSNDKSFSEESISEKKLWDDQHVTGFRDWFHYYVESAIPTLTITAPNQEVNKHATLVIGHGRAKKSANKCKRFRLGNLPCMDTAELFDKYIVQDDNQIPYSEEEMGHFTQNRDYKLSAFVVPLDRHVFLEASSAINICDTFIAQQHENIRMAVENIRDKYERFAEEQRDNQVCKQYEYMVETMRVSLENPITIRYYLANSARYKGYRIKSVETLEDKKFYANVAMPKAVWVAEISTFGLYQLGHAFAEVVIDATASNRSKESSIILLKVANFGVYRLPNETYNDFKNKLETKKFYLNLNPIFSLFSNFANVEWDKIDDLFEHV